MNIKKMLQISIMAAVCFGMGTISAMNQKKEEVVVCKTVKDRKYAVVGCENDGYFCEINSNKKVFLEGYEPAKKDVIAISKNGQFAGVIQTKEIFVHRPYNGSTRKDVVINNKIYRIPINEFPIQGYIAKLTVWNTHDGSKKYEKEYSTDSLDFENIKWVDIDNSGSCFMKVYHNGKFGERTLFSFLTSRTHCLNGYGDTHFFTKEEVSPLMLYDFTNKTVPITIDYKNYENTDKIKIDTLSSARILVYKINGHTQMRHCSAARGAVFLPNNNIIITFDDSTTDVVTFDPIKGTMKGYVLPFALDSRKLIFLKSKAILTDGNKVVHKIYYDKNEDSDQNNMVTYAKTGKFCDLIVE